MTAPPGSHLPLRTRPLVAKDQDRLWDWLHVALWDPPPAGLRPREILQAPPVRIYAEDWGRAGDVGVVGELDGENEPIGACWMRCLPAGVGLASIDADTPQLGISLLPMFQYKGYGQVLMMAALNAGRDQGYRQVSLTVHPQNPAIRLYQRCGFEKRDLRNGYHLMVAKL
jgi:ribosomal protein S18 acetylase RimI-like enzyme